MDRIHLSSPSNTYIQNDTPYKRNRRRKGGEGGKNSRDAELCTCTFGQLSTEFEIFRKLAAAFPRLLRSRGEEERRGMIMLTRRGRGGLYRLLTLVALLFAAVYIHRYSRYSCAVVVVVIAHGGPCFECFDNWGEELKVEFRGIFFFFLLR